MELTDWAARWAAGQIGFHRSQVTPQLERFVSQLSDRPATETRVLVPLAGKSLDMAYLAARGYPVVGVEGVEQAIKAFFSEAGVTPARSRTGVFERYEGQGVVMLQGDMLSLRPETAGHFEAIYDRAALVALTHEQRWQYAETLLALLAPGGRMLLVAFEYDQRLSSGPPFSVDPREILSLYGERCSVELLDSDDIIKREPRFQARGLTSMLESTWLLRKR